MAAPTRKAPPSNVKATACGKLGSQYLDLDKKRVNQWDYICEYCCIYIQMWYTCSIHYMWAQHILHVLFTQYAHTPLYHVSCMCMLWVHREPRIKSRIESYPTFCFEHPYLCVQQPLLSPAGSFQRLAPSQPRGCVTWPWKARCGTLQYFALVVPGITADFDFPWSPSVSIIDSGRVRSVFAWRTNKLYLKQAAQRSCPEANSEKWRIETQIYQIFQQVLCRHR